MVVDNRAFGVFQYRRKRFDFVRNVGVAEHGPVEQLAKFFRVELLRQFQQFEQVDNLVVAPVADIAPWVVWFLHLPIGLYPSAVDALTNLAMMFSIKAG